MQYFCFLLILSNPGLFFFNLSGWSCGEGIMWQYLFSFCFSSFSYLLDFQNNCLVTSTRQRRIQGGLWRLSPPPYGFQGGIVPKLVLSPIKRKNVIPVCTHFWIRPWTPKTKIRNSKNKIHFCKSSLLKFCKKKWKKGGGGAEGVTSFML